MVMQNRENITYVKKASGKDMSRLARAIIFPIAVFFLSIIGITVFKQFGKILMAPLIGAMWIVGAACAFWMPSHRKSIITETLMVIASYNGLLLALRQLIAITSGVSSQMLMATFGQPLATASANTIPGFLQNMLYISAAMVPLSYFSLEIKRVLQFKRSNDKRKTIEQLRMLHNNNGGKN